MSAPAVRVRLDPGYLADILRREVAYIHRDLAVQAESDRGPELGGFALERIAHLLRTIAELEEEWARRHAEGDELQKRSGGGAKEATFGAATAPSEPSPGAPR